MKLSSLPLKPTPRVLRHFAAAWLVVFLLLALRHIIAGHRTAGAVLGAVSLIGIIGLLKPAAVRWLFIGAVVAAFPVGWVVTQAVLAVMFYVVLTPLALVFRWRGRDALQLRQQPERTTFWTDRGDPPDASRYLKQF
jgi:hypothetical protein